MASYKLLFKKSVAKDFRKIPRAEVPGLLKRIEMLAQNPRGPGCKKLSGGNYFRIRHGAYRVVYEIRNRELVVNVIRVAHRSAAYS